MLYTLFINLLRKKQNVLRVTLQVPLIDAYRVQGRIRPKAPELRKL